MRRRSGNYLSYSLTNNFLCSDDVNLAQTAALLAVALHVPSVLQMLAVAKLVPGRTVLVFVFAVPSARAALVLAVGLHPRVRAVGSQHFAEFVFVFAAS